MEKSRKNTRFTRILLVIVISPLSLLSGEAFTRALFPQNVDDRMNIYKSDSIIGFTYAPNATTHQKGREYNVYFQINSAGLRDRKYEKKENGTFRVLLLGDSFSVSHGLEIENSLPRQLERALQAAVKADGIDTTIQVVNAAVGGYSPYNYWKAYGRWRPMYEPDLVFVGLSPDDYDCSNEHARYWIENGVTLGMATRSEDLRKQRVNVITRVRKWLSWNSQFYVLLRNFLYYNNIVGRILRRLKAQNADQGGQLDPFRVPPEENLWDKTFLYLASLKVETQQDGVPLVVAPIPLKLEIDESEYAAILSANQISESLVDMKQPLRQIGKFCKEKEIPVLDARSELRQCQSCYFKYDGHWNTKGVRAAVQAFVHQWRELRLPPWDG